MRISHTASRDEWPAARLDLLAKDRPPWSARCSSAWPPTGPTGKA